MTQAVRNLSALRESPIPGRKAHIQEPALVSCVHVCPAEKTGRQDHSRNLEQKTMTDSSGQKVTITLELGQVAVVLGMEGEEVTRQLFASPEVDALLDEVEADIPFNYFLAAAFLTRLDEDDNFAAELADWYDEKLQSEAGEAEAAER
jgi:hypothetical protein